MLVILFTTVMSLSERSWQHNAASSTYGMDSKRKFSPEPQPAADVCPRHQVPPLSLACTCGSIQQPV